ncbi:MAG: histidine kinase, partial [Bacteroidota bacterium]
MTKCFPYLLSLLLFCLSANVMAQDKTKSSSKLQRLTQEQLLDRARKVKAKSPTEAIRLVEQALTSKSKNKSKKKSSNIETEAYLLLGNIYEDINQLELALQRYDQAIDIEEGGKDDRYLGLLYERKGQILLTQEAADAAEKSFKACLSWSRDKSLSLRCEEGLADVQLLRKDAKASISQIEALEEKYTLDSMARVRQNLRRSEVYVQQQEYDKASESLRNSVNSLPTPEQEATKAEPAKAKKPASKKDLERVRKATENLIEKADLNTAEQVDLKNQIAVRANDRASNNERIRENLDIAALLVKENKVAEADDYILQSKPLISDKTEMALAAEVYKRSAAIHQRQGNYSAAMSDLDRYSSAREAAIEAIEADLRQQIEIVKGQKQIDVRQRDLSIEEKDEALLRTQLFNQQIITGILGAVLLASLVYFYFLYKNIRAKRRANQLLLLKSLRTQMNPHFIFNALNSVNNFIAKNDEKAANKFLSEFSSLMRRVLDYSQQDFISFEEEMELNALYLKLEHFRFREKFDYQFDNAAKAEAFD